MFLHLAHEKAGAEWEEGLERVHGKDSGEDNKPERLVKEQKVNLDGLSASWDLFPGGNLVLSRQALNVSNTWSCGKTLYLNPNFHYNTARITKKHSILVAYPKD
ncbi:hypothetical protein yc1106_00518 [Curvularia clavata]|uniref:Uncharacterized protein n=1 Tax=Curvularia clavata TaxID=95742 RepID=A0A9Q8Z028_CURCL|nr:hypothetical protein yc1106_00518 [Curvularia clavata]